MGYYSISKEKWESFLKISTDDLPDKLIIQGAIDFPTYIEKWSQVLENVRPGWMPNLMIGDFKGQTIAYGACFGGPIASQFAHIYSKLGTKAVIQIGICGGLQGNIELGDIVVSEGVLSLDGSARLYGQTGEHVEFDETLRVRAISHLKERGVTFHVGRTVSYYDILLETAADLEDLSSRGYLAVEMEAAAVGAVARHFNTPALSILTVSDNSISGKDLFYEQTDDEGRRITEGIRTIFDIALAV